MKRATSAALVGIAGLAVIAMTGARHHATGDQHEAIKRTALDYIEGWYEGNAERMERALHPELAKRVLMYDPNSKSLKINQMSALTLVQRTRDRSGRSVTAADQRRDVTLLDVFGNAASVKVVANDWVDYLHMTHLDGRWQIVNVLWELNPTAKRQRGFPEK